MLPSIKKSLAAAALATLAVSTPATAQEETFDPATVLANAAALANVSALCLTPQINRVSGYLAESGVDSMSLDIHLALKTCMVQNLLDSGALGGGFNDRAQRHGSKPDTEPARASSADLATALNVIPEGSQIIVRASGAALK